jgi:hypothetical protein
MKYRLIASGYSTVMSIDDHKSRSQDKIGLYNQ